MKNRSKVYLVSGRTGAGKTTIAKRLEKENSAFRISHDEWLRVAYGEKIEKDRFRECCERLSRLVWQQVERLADVGIDVILEGWGTRKLRDEARRELKRIGVNYQFLFVECPRDMRSQRIRERNRNLGVDGFYISEEDFDRMENLKEEFDEDEEVTLIDNSTHNQPVDTTPAEAST